MTEESDSKGLTARRRRIVIGVAVGGVALAAALGVGLGLAFRDRRSAGTEAAARILAAYSESLRALRKAQKATADPDALALLAAKERRLRVLTAVGLGGVLKRSGEPALRDAIEDEVREALSAFPDSGAVLGEIEGEYFQSLAREDADFARDLTGLLEFLVSEEGRGIEAKQRELEELKAKRDSIRKELVPGRREHEGNGE